jgi:hypothetical protein
MSGPAIPKCPTCGDGLVSRRHRYPDGRKRFFCRDCSDRVGWIEESFGRAVAVDRVARPEWDRLGRELARWEHMLNDPEDPAEVTAWIRSLGLRVRVEHALGGATSRDR